MLNMGRVEVLSGGINIFMLNITKYLCRVPVFIDNADQELTGIYLNNKSIPENIKHREG